APASSPEGTAISLIGTVIDLGSADTHSYCWNVTKDGNPYAGGSGASFLFTPGDNGAYVVSLTVTDDDGGTGTDSRTITVTIVAPTIGPITAPVAPVPINSPISTSAGFSDPGWSDTHTAVWDWGDGSTSPGAVTESGGQGAVSATHIYTGAGVYTITL